MAHLVPRFLRERQHHPAVRLLDLWQMLVVQLAESVRQRAIRCGAVGRELIVTSWGNQLRSIASIEESSSRRWFAQRPALAWRSTPKSWANAQLGKQSRAR